MNLSVRVRVAVVLTGSVLTVMACGGGAARTRAQYASPPPELVKPLQVPPSPYYIIYSPPVNLAKPPDTTAHARKVRD